MSLQPPYTAMLYYACVQSIRQHAMQKEAPHETKLMQISNWRRVLITTSYTSLWTNSSDTLRSSSFLNIFSASSRITLSTSSGWNRISPTTISIIYALTRMWMYGLLSKCGNKGCSRKQTCSWRTALSRPSSPAPGTQPTSLNELSIDDDGIHLYETSWSTLHCLCDPSCLQPSLWGQKNTEAAHTTRHLEIGGVACTHVQAICGNMIRKEPDSGIWLQHSWWCWHERSAETGIRRANTMLGVSCGATQANTCRDLGDTLLKQQFPSTYLLVFSPIITSVVVHCVLIC